MKKLLTLGIGLFASLQLMAGSACCPATAAKTTKKEDAKPVVAAATLQNAVMKASKEECAGMKCADKADCGDKVCDTTMKRLGESWQAMKADKASKVDTASLKQIMAQSTGAVVILDARTNKYDDGKRIPGAQMVGPAPTKEQIAKLIPAKDSYVITYCGGIKCPLAGKLSARLAEYGYTNVVEYSEGIGGWVAAGNEVAAVATN